MIEVTDAAAKRIRDAMASEGQAGGGLRVGVKAGGCSGLSYVFQWETAARPGDEVFDAGHDMRIFVDRRATGTCAARCSIATPTCSASR